MQKYTLFRHAPNIFEKKFKKDAIFLKELTKIKQNKGDSGENRREKREYRHFAWKEKQCARKQKKHIHEGTDGRMQENI